MRHRVKVRILVILASVLAFLAIFTSWIDQQLLDTNEWVHTSGRLLEDKEISDAVATYSVDQLYANVDVTRLIKNRLPGDLQQLASPASAGIREIATRAAMRAFQSQRVQNLWQDANRVAHTQLVAILEDEHRGDLEPEREGGARPEADRLPARGSARLQETGRERGLQGRADRHLETRLRPA